MKERVLPLTVESSVWADDVGGSLRHFVVLGSATDQHQASLAVDLESETQNERKNKVESKRR